MAQRFSREVEENKDCLEQLRAPGDLKRMESTGRHGAILTVESGAALGGKLEHIQDFQRLGVRMCTLTWNGATELGRGVMAPGTTGLTDFGRQAVAAMEDAGILVDLSHASPELFWDVAEMARKPLVASHSNAKAICGHPRNLTKEQFEAICHSGGLVGLNFFTAFLNDQPKKHPWKMCCATRNIFSLWAVKTPLLWAAIGTVRLYPRICPGCKPSPLFTSCSYATIRNRWWRSFFMGMLRGCSESRICFDRIVKVRYSYTT